MLTRTIFQLFCFGIFINPPIHCNAGKCRVCVFVFRVFQFYYICEARKREIIEKGKPFQRDALTTRFKRGKVDISIRSNAILNKFSIHSASRFVYSSFIILRNSCEISVIISHSGLKSFFFFCYCCCCCCYCCCSYLILCTIALCGQTLLIICLYTHLICERLLYALCVSYTFAIISFR